MARHGEVETTEVFSSLEQAGVGPDGVVVLSAEMDTVHYVTAPASAVRCSAEQLTTLAFDLDAVYWMGGRNGFARVSFHAIRAPYAIEGAEGGGVVTGSFWSNPHYLDDEVAASTRDVMEGRRPRLPGGLLRDRRTARLASLRSDRESRPPFVLCGEVLPWDYDVDDPVVPFPETDD